MGQKAPGNPALHPAPCATLISGWAFEWRPAADASEKRRHVIQSLLVQTYAKQSGGGGAVLSLDWMSRGQCPSPPNTALRV